MGEITNFCHARRHLRGARLSIYEYAAAVSKHSGVCNVTIGRFARETTYGRDTVVATLRSLTKDGWLKKQDLNKSQVKHGKPFLANSYHVVKHDAWAAEHPGQCPDEDEDGKPESRVGEIPTRKNSDAEKSDIPDAEKPSASESEKVVNPDTEKLRHNPVRDPEGIQPSIQTVEWMGRYFRSITDRPMPVTDKARELCQGWVKEHGAEVTKECFRLWVDSSDINFLLGLTHPVLVFRKFLPDWLAAAKERVQERKWEKEQQAEIQRQLAEQDEKAKAELEDLRRKRQEKEKAIGAIPDFD